MTDYLFHAKTTARDGSVYDTQATWATDKRPTLEDIEGIQEELKERNNSISVVILGFTELGPKDAE